MIYSEFDSLSQRSFPVKSIGVKEIVVPKHVMKWKYRNGMGAFPEPGDLILCKVGVWTIEGSEILAKNNSQLTTFIIGKGRLIQGLELVLSCCQKSEVFKVKISPLFAYDDREDIKMIPPSTTLIFDISVVDITKPKPQSQNITELTQELNYMLEKADDEIRKSNPQKAVQILRLSLKLSQKLRSPQSPLGQKIIVKMANIFLANNDPDGALKVLDEFSHEEKRHFLLSRCKIKIYEEKGQQLKLVEQMKAKYQKYWKNEPIKKEIRQFFRRIDKLGQLKFMDEVQLKKEEYLEDQTESRRYHSLGMRDFFF